MSSSATNGGPSGAAPLQQVMGPRASPTDRRRNQDLPAFVSHSVHRSWFKTCVVDSDYRQRYVYVQSLAYRSTARVASQSYALGDDTSPVHKPWESIPWLFMFRYLRYLAASQQQHILLGLWPFEFFLTGWDRVPIVPRVGELVVSQIFCRAGSLSDVMCLLESWLSLIFSVHVGELVVSHIFCACWRAGCLSYFLCLSESWLSLIFSVLVGELVVSHIFCACWRAGCLSYFLCVLESWLSLMFSVRELVVSHVFCAGAGCLPES